MKTVYEYYKEMYTGITENNKINKGKWSDWQDASALEVYLDDISNENALIAERFIKKAKGPISAFKILKQLEKAEYGINF